MPYPLHPAVVHFPVVLAVALPFLALAGFLAARRPGAGRYPWGVVVAFAVLLPLSAWAALETGEEQEDTVEAVVGEAPLHRHEEAAEGFLAGAVLLGALALGGLLPRKAGAVARIATVPVAVAVLALAFRVGDSGGELVYRHGAAAAYVQAGGARGAAAVGGSNEDRDEEGEHARRNR